MAGGQADPMTTRPRDYPTSSVTTRLREGPPMPPKTGTLVAAPKQPPPMPPKTAPLVAAARTISAEQWHEMVEAAIKSWDLAVPDPVPQALAPPGHVAACAYGCCWKLPGQTWDEAQKRVGTKKARTPRKGPPPMPPRKNEAHSSRLTGLDALPGLPGPGF